MTANIIRKKDWVRATTGPTNETAPVEIALQIKGNPRPPVTPAIKPRANTLVVKVSKLNAITKQIMTSAIELEQRRVFRQVDSWVDLPPKVFVKAFDKAFEKEATSPIICQLLTGLKQGRLQTFLST